MKVLQLAKKLGVDKTTVIRLEKMEGIPPTYYDRLNEILEKGWIEKATLALADSSGLVSREEFRSLEATVTELVKEVRRLAQDILGSKQTKPATQRKSGTVRKGDLN